MSVSAPITINQPAIEESLRYDQTLKKKLATDLLKLLDSQKKQFSAQSLTLKRFKELDVNFGASLVDKGKTPIDKIYTQWETFCIHQDPLDSDNYLQDMYAIVDKLSMDNTKTKTCVNLKSYLKAYTLSITNLTQKQEKLEEIMGKKFNPEALRSIMYFFSLKPKTGRPVCKK
jgi:hypothetical protein